MALFGATGGSEQALTIVIKARNEALAELKKAQSAVESFRSKNEDLLKNTARVSGVATAAIGAMGIAAVKAAGDMEQTRVAFDTMLGSAEKGGAFLKELYDFAKRTPFTITSIEEAGKKLLAYNIAQEEVLPTLKTLGDTAAAVGTDKFPQLVLAYGQVRAAGKLFGTELRQFTETGVPLIAGLAEHFGVAESAIRDMVEQGKVGFEDVRTVLQDLTGEGGKFENLMEKQAETLGGMVSNLQDSWTLFLRNQGSQFLGFAKAVVGGLTNIINAVQKWSEANPRLSSTVFGAVGALTALTAVVSTGLLILPKLTGAIVALGTAMRFLALNPIGLMITGLTMVGVAFVKLADTVGGFQRAWHIVVANIERIFWVGVQSILKGINFLAQYIPGIGDLVGTALDEVTAKVDGAAQRYQALITEGVNEVAASSAEMGDVSADAFDKISVAAASASEDAIKAAESVARVEKQVTDLQKTYLGDLIDAKKDYAEAYVEQEEKVADMRNEIRKLQRSEDTDENATRLRELQSTYEREKEALRSAKTIEMQLNDEVVEARRRASLTDFEREIEDIQRRQVARQAEFNEKMATLQKELAAELDKQAQVRSAEAQTTRIVSEEVNKREKDTISSVNRQIKAYEQLAEAKSGGKKSFDFGFATANSTPAYRGFATGGVVDGPLGSPRMILAHGGERVIPNGHKESSNGQPVAIININNPVVRSREDITQFRRQMELAWRDVGRINKLSVT